MASFAESGVKLVTECKEVAASHWRSAMVDLGLVIAGAGVAAGDAEHNGLKLGHISETGVKLEHPTLVGALALTGVTAGVGYNHLRKARRHAQDGYRGEIALRMNQIHYVDPAAIKATQEFYASYQKPR